MTVILIVGSMNARCFLANLIIAIIKFNQEYIIQYHINKVFDDIFSLNMILDVILNINIVIKYQSRLYLSRTYSKYV